MLLIALFPTSCSPLKKAAATTLWSRDSLAWRADSRRGDYSAEQLAASRQDTLHSLLTARTQTAGQSAEQWETTCREYDTSRPVDPQTGTPPLMRETTRTQRRHASLQQTRTAAQTREQSRTETRQARRRQFGTTQTSQTGRAGRQTQIQSHSSEKRGMNPLQRVLCLLGAAGIALAALWYGRRVL